ncbi:hypothetical protein [Flavobacterium sedimenticola]|uniref:Uncharacterized protein n=1 Tax=Flavobacterium sedimenticola TaxID=3043286 RepID=A0ABT6XNU6_9FLAO|nr:hypothetical protein [Flavobacterium sedimenticola]MDI9256324.1 hypothetical protein [Flavobacterium sedimenticola]
MEKEIKELEKLGVVDPSWSRNIKIVERYTLMRQEGIGVYECYELIAEEERLSASSIKKIVTKLIG